MTPETKTIDLELRRIIPASPSEAFDGWLDPKCPGTPWSVAKKLVLDAKLDGLYYWLFINEAGEGKHHYARFTIVDRPSQVQFTWVALDAPGVVSLVRVDFEQRARTRF